MRYFYYGMDNRKNVLSADQTKPEQREYREDDLVIEEENRERLPGWAAVNIIPNENHRVQV